MNSAPPRTPPPALRGPVPDKASAAALADSIARDVLGDLLPETEFRQHWSAALALMVWYARHAVSETGAARDDVVEALQSATSDFLGQLSKVSESERQAFETRLRLVAASVEADLTKRIVSVSAADFLKNRQAMQEAAAAVLAGALKTERAQVQKLHSELTSAHAKLVADARDANTVRLLHGVLQWITCSGIALLALWAGQRLL